MKKIIHRYLPTFISAILLFLICWYCFTIGYFRGGKDTIVPPAIKSVETVIEVEKEIEKIIEVPPLQDYESLGDFKITAYCPCQQCSGGYGHSTATGAVCVEGITIAVDPKIIPYGSIIIINGKCYIAQDCGAAVKGKVIDIFFENHDSVKEFGAKRMEVFIAKAKN